MTAAGRWRMAAAIPLVGMLAAAAGIALTLIMHLVQHLAFGYGSGSFLIGVEDAVPWRRVAALLAGGLLVGIGWWLLRRRVDVEDVSVTRALRDRSGRLPVLATVGDAVLQIVGIAAGASLGREGAPRQASAALAGWTAGRLRLSAEQRHTLLACGAGAGLAAVYNVPVSGALFTLEILLASRALKDVVPAVLTSAIATVLTWPVLSARPTYDVAHVTFSAPVLVWAVLLGPVAGLAGVGFVRITTLTRTHAPRGAWVIVGIVVAFAAVGAVGMAFPELLGNGKGQAQLAFAGGVGLATAAALFVLKPLATAACLGGGAIGGLLTPSLATGAALGVLGGHLWTQLWPGSSVIAYAIVGAAALLAVTQRAPITAMALTLEFVHTGFDLLPAIIVAVALAMTTAWLVDRHMTPLGMAALTRRPGPHASGPSRRAPSRSASSSMATCSGSCTTAGGASGSISS